MSDREFDLAPFRPVALARIMPIVRFLVAIGIVFTASGILTGWLVAGGVTSSVFWWVVGAFSIGGWAPSALLLAVHPYRWTRRLSVGDQGLRLVDSTGRSSWYPWERPGLMVRFTEAVGETLPPSGSPTSSALFVSPPPYGAIVGLEARDAILEQATAHGFSASVQEYDATTRPGQRPAARTRQTLLSRGPSDAALPSAAGSPGLDRAALDPRIGPQLSAQSPGAEGCWSTSANDARLHASFRATNWQSLIGVAFLVAFGAAFVGLGIAMRTWVGLLFGVPMLVFGLVMARLVLRSMLRRATSVTVTRDELVLQLDHGRVWRRRWTDPGFAARLIDYRRGVALGPASLVEVPCAIESQGLYAGLSPEAMDGIRRASERAGTPVLDGQIGTSYRAVFLGKVPQGVRPIPSPVRSDGAPH
jgi:hypothetical protein